jgi:hypothetical protein
MKKITVILILLFFIARPVICDIEALLGNGMGARGVGMGLAQVAASKGVDGVFWNPATIAEIKAFEISTTASEVYGTNYKTVGVVLPTVDGGWGLLVLTADQGGIPETTLDESDRPVVTGSDFGYDAKAIYLSYAKDFGAVALGTSIKYLAEDLAGNSASGIGADVGVELKPSKVISLGAKIENVIVPQMEWDTDSDHTDRIEPNFRIGAAVRPNRGNLLITGDLNLKKDKSPEFFIGGEYDLIQNLTLRGGVFDGRLSAGVGLSYKNFGIDYSYAKGNDFLEDSHRVSLSFTLGPDGRRADMQPGPVEEEVKNVALKNYKEIEYQEIPETLVREDHFKDQELEGPEVIRDEKVQISIPSYIPWHTSNADTEDKTPNSDEKKSINLLCGPGCAGKILYFKVETPGIDSERVSVVYNNQLVKLYSDDGTVWKGAIMISPNTSPGKHKLKIYVADVDGHLYKELKEFSVKARPQPEIMSKALRINDTNNFEVAVSPGVDRATLVLDNRKIPLQIKNGIASANFYLDHDPERKILYLSDTDGHLFTYPLSLNVENGSSTEKVAAKEESQPEDSLKLEKGAVSKEANDIFVKTHEDSLSSILLVLLGITTGLGLWMAFSKRRG